jgi:FkbM family methyltransferase
MTGVVWAVEPLPDNSAVLSRLATDNHLAQLRVLSLALGAADGAGDLRLPTSAGESGWASFTASWNTGGTLNVPIRSLDSLVAEMKGSSRRLDLLKLDVEGYESDVLAGAVHTLAEHKPLLYVEFNDLLLRDVGSSSAALLSHLRDLNYTVDAATALDETALSGACIDLLLRPDLP